MSYENTTCVCGGKKIADTMLCLNCVSVFSDRRELRDYLDTTLSTEIRRSAAIILVTLANKRKPYLGMVRV